MMPGGLRYAVPALAIGIGLALCSGSWVRALGFTLGATLLWALGWVLPVYWGGPISLIIASISVYTIRVLAIVSIGTHIALTVSPTRLSAALRAWRLPRAISVTLAVMFRFFPVVLAEAFAVLDAMRLRGLTGTRAIVRHPILSIEHFIVPMVASSLRAAEDLSASAVLRGLGSRHTPTSLTPPRFGSADLAFAVIAAALVTATVFLPSPLT